MAKYSKEYYRLKKGDFYKEGAFDPYEEYFGIPRDIVDDWDKRAMLMYTDNTSDRGKGVYMKRKDQLDG